MRRLQRAILFWLAVLLIQSNTPPSTYAQDTNRACLDFSSNLAVGERARVIVNTSPNNIRVEPSTVADRVGQIPAGGEFQILAGPRCVEGLTWWSVEYNDIQGWTAEGQGNDHWLEPLEHVSTPRTQNVIISGGRAGNISIREGIPVSTLRGMAIDLGGGGFPSWYYQSIGCGHPQLAWKSVPEMETASLTTIGLISEDLKLTFVQHNATVEMAPWRGLLPEICTFDEIYQVSAIGPDGRTVAPVVSLVSSDLNLGQRDVQSVILPMEALTEPGIWHLQLNSFSLRIRVASPQEPVFYRDEQLLWLGGFQADERVGVLYLSSQGLGEYWAAVYETDSQGSFLGPELANVTGLHILEVIGEQSGRAEPARLWPDTITSFGARDSYVRFDASAYEQALRVFLFGVAPEGQTCPGLLASQLDIGGRGLVIPNLGSNNLRLEPSIRAAGIGQIPENGIFDVIYGPECNASEGIPFWLVNYQGLIGWTAEGQGTTYWLKPVATR